VTALLAELVLSCADLRTERRKSISGWRHGAPEGWEATLALKLAAGQAERGSRWLRLVFLLSASSMEQD